MGEYAPDAIKWLASQIIDKLPGSYSPVLSGIVGDSQHGSGYHRSRNALKARGLTGDYSIQLTADKAGDGDAASALDIKMSSTGMKSVTKRLMDSAKNPDDPRLNVMREFYGTLNGTSVAGWDTFYNRSATSDSTHLWHVHFSFLRKYATDKAALSGVLSVVLGESPGDDDMTPAEMITADVLKNRPWRGDYSSNPTVQYGFGVTSIWDGVHNLEVAANASRLREEAILAAVSGLDTEAVIAAVNAKAAEDSARDAQLRSIIENQAQLSATEVVARLGAVLSGTAG